MDNISKRIAYEKQILPLLTEIEKVCEELHIPYFTCFALPNKDETNENIDYKQLARTFASFNIANNDDKIVEHIKINNGFQTMNTEFIINVDSEIYDKIETNKDKKVKATNPIIPIKPKKVCENSQKTKGKQPIEKKNKHIKQNSDVPTSTTGEQKFNIPTSTTGERLNIGFDNFEFEDLFEDIAEDISEDIE